MGEKIILLLDADGCIFSKDLINKKQGNGPDDWTYTVSDLFNAHPRLWCYIFKLAEVSQPDGIELISASFLRQTPELDSHYSRTYQTGLFSLLIPEIINLLKKFMSISEIKSIADIQESKTRLPHLMNIKPPSGSPGNNDSLPPFDIMFISIYLLLQQLAKDNEGKNRLKIFMTNADPRLLDKLQHIFLDYEKNNIFIIPINMTLYLCEYDNVAQEIAIKAIFRGQGSINRTLKMFEASLKNQYFNIVNRDQNNSAFAYSGVTHMPVEERFFSSMYKELERAHSDNEVVPHVTCNSPSSRFNDPDGSNLKFAACRSTQKPILTITTPQQPNFFSLYKEKIHRARAATTDLLEKNVGSFKDIPLIYPQNTEALTETKQMVEQNVTIDATQRRMSPASNDSPDISTSKKDASVESERASSEVNNNIPLTETVQTSYSWFCCC